MKYHYCKKNELIKFARDRNLTVPNTAQIPIKGPYHRDYIQALRQADRDVTFRFLSLPAEMRTWIYKDLLILQDAFTCHPQILRVCKQINQEASNILYGDNLFEAKMHPDGVYAHGVKCGEYRPTYTAARLPVDYTLLRWPDFLSRVQFLHVSIPVHPWSAHTNTFWLTAGSRLPALGNVLHSLATFLKSGNRLRYCAIEIPAARFAPELDSDAVDTACYPLRLLGPRITIKLFDSAMDRDVHILTSPSSGIDGTESLGYKTSIACNAVVTASELALRAVSVSGGRQAGLEDTVFYIAGWSALRGLKEVLRRGPQTSRACTGAVSAAVQKARWEMEAVGAAGVGTELNQRVQELLRMEVDLRVAGEEEGQGGEGEGSDA
ncbi:hypothetical protein CLAFUW4_08430 [Fulvia fulva]|uniref:Uncharacterized protein n=1 Tax=Passalora fulva TaxID=5499 RepID=A0A9Q8P718_PASFU|nr:uncharacterized protein CLAFUR5_08534 [Fulvia fulva]KAK4628715.1 hypothetical protein CLAFUR4_08435 [Fulvia fulva]KAK4630793.1 hypothetical protein CLAFUR0_08430 [Fulvia fulva]UJO15422.1 hypothetical protein CLAFUR5_08534 [Fulvia fulva]WPV13032.1 hypothetical protein CLAFUW4_08430 [Fulvia fulva]WPV27695.1 hypothetical protein CLAFUW7_08430 [Fulvia fulva]